MEAPRGKAVQTNFSWTDLIVGALFCWMQRTGDET